MRFQVARIAGDMVEVTAPGDRGPTSVLGVLELTLVSPFGELRLTDWRGEQPRVGDYFNVEIEKSAK